MTKTTHSSRGSKIVFMNFYQHFIIDLILMTNYLKRSFRGLNSPLQSLGGLRKRCLRPSSKHLELSKPFEVSNNAFGQVQEEPELRRSLNCIFSENLNENRQCYSTYDKRLTLLFKSLSVSVITYYPMSPSNTRTIRY